jgi:hypothetical protein
MCLSNSLYFKHANVHNKCEKGRSYKGRVLWTSRAFPCSPYIFFILLIICSHHESYNQYIQMTNGRVFLRHFLCSIPPYGGIWTIINNGIVLDSSKSVKVTINIYRFQLWQINTFNFILHIWRHLCSDPQTLEDMWTHFFPLINTVYIDCNFHDDYI